MDYHVDNWLQVNTLLINILKAKTTAIVASVDAKGVLIWVKGSAWNNSSADSALLRDSLGRLVF